MTRRGVMGLLVGAGMALVGCTSNDDRYRFRLTIEVDTPDGLRTGSSVYEIAAGTKPKLMAEEGSRYLSNTGEAVAVDLPGDRTLFALLKTGAHFEDMATLSMEAFDPQFSQQFDTVGSARRIAERSGIRTKAIVGSSNYPMLVTFRDIRDPKSIERVDSAALDKNFGPGVTLRRITVAVTDEPVTTGIEKRLGWLTSARIMNNPGWASLPYETRVAINGMFSGTIKERK